MTTEREHREAERLSRQFENTVQLPVKRRLKSIDELDGEPRIRGYVRPKRRPSAKRFSAGLRRYRLRVTLRRAVRWGFGVAILSTVALQGALVVSCRLHGDPTPSADWLVRYGVAPWSDAGESENCQINTAQYWKHQSIEWISDHWEAVQGFGGLSAR